MEYDTSKLKDKIKEEKAFLKAATPLIKDESDLKYFKDSKKSLQAGEALADNDEKLAILWLHFASLRNKLTFLLFRTGDLTEELEKEFRGLDAIETVNELVNGFDAEHKKEEDEFKAIAQKQYEREQKMDIFKAVCNGMSIEEAEAKLKQYEEQVKQSMRQNG